MSIQEHFYKIYGRVPNAIDKYIENGKNEALLKKNVPVEKIHFDKFKSICLYFFYNTSWVFFEF